jgi:sugar transferase (PEP-CTERM/EpsH1 system associated)
MDDLLFLSQRIPYPPTKGEKIRHLQILRYLRRHFYVYLGCFVDDPVDWQHIETIRELCEECYFAPLRPGLARLASLRGLAGNDPLTRPYFHHRGLAKWVSGIIERRRPAAAVVCSSVMAQYVVGGAGRPRRLLIDYCDVDSDKWRQYAGMRRGAMRWIYARESRTLLDFDRRIGAGCDVGVFATGSEAALFSRLAPELAGKIAVVSNGVDAAYFSPNHPFANPYAAKSVVFTGTMNYWPNVDAVTWFADRVFPRVRRQIPDLQFYVVGSNPSPAVVRLADREGIVVTGRVDDVRPYLAHAAAVVVPLRIANGVQNKVLEAMAMARPVVATTRALAGVDVDQEREVIVAEPDAKALAAALVSALARDDLAAMGMRARARMLKSYDWDINMAALAPLLGIAAWHGAASPTDTQDRKLA